MVLGKRFVRAKGFPYTATGARYVRARKENGLGNVTILRHIVGGEQCPKGLGWKKAIIRFSSNGKSVLFINGRRVAVNVRARKFKTVVRNVRRGDVIAVSVRAQKGPKGVIVDVYHSKTHYPTGRGHWKVHKFVKTWQPKWKFPSFSSCKWERGVRAARVVRAVGFPYKTSRARYVWADPNESGSPNSLILRHVVGGENCVRGNRNRSKIRFSADQRAVLFINGVRIAAIRNPKRYKFVSRSLKRGDVVAIVAQNRGRRGRGVIADVFHGKRHFATGSRSWRAHFFAPRKGRPFRQTQKSFSSCKWNRAVPVAKGTQLVRASRFPYKRTGARYVWAAAGRKQRSVVVIRFVVGGENCSRNEIVQGQNNGKRTCKCRRSNGRNGICWEMINPTGTGNRCRSRVCDVKYECVGSRLAGSKICIRRIATEKVVPTGTPGICTKEDTNSVFYVPYE